MFLGLFPISSKMLPELLRVLLRRHYQEQRIPDLLERYLVQILGRQDSFRNWPLETIVPEKEAFFSFLQERWPHFLNHLAGRAITLLLGKEQTSLSFEACLGRRFYHSITAISVYMSITLFREGLLEAVPFKEASSLANSWIAIGIKTDDRDGQLRRRVAGLMDSLATGHTRRATARHDDWSRFAKSWAELLALTHWNQIRYCQMSARQKMDNACRLRLMQPWYPLADRALSRLSRFAAGFAGHAAPRSPFPLQAH